MCTYIKKKNPQETCGLTFTSNREDMKYLKVDINSPCKPSLGTYYRWLEEISPTLAFPLP